MHTLHGKWASAGDEVKDFGVHTASWMTQVPHAITRVIGRWVVWSRERGEVGVMLSLVMPPEVIGNSLLEA
jgi:hypothetical protein